MTDMICATEGCGCRARRYFESGGVGSYYCDACAVKIEAMRDYQYFASRLNNVTDAGIEKAFHRPTPSGSE